MSISVYGRFSAYVMFYYLYNDFVLSNKVKLDKKYFDIIK